MPVVGAANELYKRAKAAGLGDRDMASVYQVVNEPLARNSDQDWFKINTIVVDI